MDTTWRHFILVTYPDRVLLITQSIDIKEFIDSKGFDPLLIEKSYYVAPEKKKKSGVIDKAYLLFAKVMSETNKIAIGTVVLKDREHLVALPIS